MGDSPSGILYSVPIRATLNSVTNRMAIKPFLILQLRPEQEASDNEFEAILNKARLSAEQVLRVDLSRTRLGPDLDLDRFSGIIVGGGPGCVSDAPEDKSTVEAEIEADILGLMPEVTARDLPFLGCCYGIGILGHHLGPYVSKAKFGEGPGTSACELTEAGKQDPILQGMPTNFDAFVGHKEALQSLPEGCVHLVRSEACPFQMIRYGNHVYATQFHPEADGEGFATRIKIYKDRGYFPPEDAKALIDMCMAANVRAPEKILRNFIRRYAA